ncbi:unnamed protein product [Brassicogethes aeneus]|uniref:UDP-glucuronosyltransferase n=1 Tax=Brassicogethes aeneus TaxID=1431903 RepID=A0A9P0BF87_BRAAE|nr:unnamed protein product [Brassicogethes aeneus]
MYSLSFGLVLLVFAKVNSYNILTVFPHPGKSHFNVFQPLVKELARKGHNVTVISYFPLDEPMKNYNDVALVGDKTQQEGKITLMMRYDDRISRWSDTFFLEKMGYDSCEKNLAQHNVQALFKSDEKFDLILMEFFNSDCFSVFSEKFKAPLIGFSTCTIIPWTNGRFGNPDNPSYIPNPSLPLSDQMTFLQRVENFALTTFQKIYYAYKVSSNEDEIIKKNVATQLKPLQEIIRNSSLLLVNTHFTINLPRPLAPNVIEIGGIHVGQNKKLSKNIEKWIDGSSDGVIYFSLGSMIKGHTFPTDKRKEFLKAFGKLSQTVLWKWENETMEGKPDNVMIQKWMPQFDILCHPNVKAFISHGGLLGVTEAVHCGVPVIVMPQFGDQFTNAKALESVGGGVILHLSEATEESISKALKKVLSSKFRQQAKELSERFRDRPMSPMDTAIYWVEYVARHKGAPHMRTAAVNMPFYQYYLLDVISFLILIVSLTLYIVVYVLKTMLKLFLSSSRKVKIN